MSTTAIVLITATPLFIAAAVSIIYWTALPLLIIIPAEIGFWGIYNLAKNWTGGE